MMEIVYNTCLQTALLYSRIGIASSYTVFPLYQYLYCVFVVSRLRVPIVVVVVVAAGSRSAKTVESGIHARIHFSGKIDRIRVHIHIRICGCSIIDCHPLLLERRHARLGVDRGSCIVGCDDCGRCGEENSIQYNVHHMMEVNTVPYW